MLPSPSKPKVVFEEGNKAGFEIEGLYPGYGQTIGNGLRRVLLSSLEGAVITSVKIEGVGHEFTTIEGVMEDMVEILLNLKQLRFRIHEEGPVTITLSAKGEKEVTGADFKVPSQAELINKDAPVATLTSKKAALDMEAVVEKGRGYVPVEARSKEKVEVGVIALDASFSPVRSVNFEVENMRLGDRTDYNRVRLLMETDGSITPREAFEKAAKILVEQFSSLAEGFEELKKEEKREEYVAVPEAAKEEQTSVLKMDVSDLKLSARTLNLLREAGIKRVGALAKKKEEKLREVEGLGDKAVQEIKKALGNLGITLKQ